MAVTEELLVKIAVDSSGAVKSVKGLSGGLGKLDKSGAAAESQMKSLSSSFTKLGATVISLNQGLDLAGKAFRALAGPIQTVTKAYLVQESAEMRLQNALKLTGQFTNETFKGMKKFASGLQDVTTIGDETTLRLLSIATAMGLSADESQKLVEGAADLSAATGRELDSSFQQLIKTMGGFAGELGEVLPAVKELSKEQLQNLEVLDVIRDQFGGFAQGELVTLQGSLAQSSNAFGDLLEEIGQTISQLVDLPNLAKIATSAFQNMGKSVAQLRDTLNSIKAAFGALDFDELANSVRNLAFAFVGLFAAMNATAVVQFVSALGGLASIKDIIPAMQLFVSSLAGSGMVKALATITALSLKFVIIAGSIALAASAVDIFARNLDNLGEVWKLVSNLIIAGFQSVRAAAIRFLIQPIQEFSVLIFEMLSKIGLTSEEDVATGMEAVAKSITKQEQALQKQAEAISNVEQAAAKLDLGLIGQGLSVFRDLVKDTKEEASGLGKVLDTVSEADIPSPRKRQTSTPFSILQPEQIKEVGSLLGESFAESLSNLNDVMSPMTAPIQGAALAASGAASALLGPISAASGIADAIQGLIDAIPQLLSKIAGIFNSLTDLPDMILSGLMDVTASISRFLTEFVPNLARALPLIIRELFINLPTAIREGVFELLNALPMIVDELVAALPSLIKDFIDGFAKAIPKFIEFFLVKAPMIGIKIAEALLIGVPKALAEGFMGALTGVDLDIGVSEESLKSLESNFTNISDQLFGVVDLEVEARGFDKAQQIEEALNRGISVFDRIFRVLMSLWQAVFKTGEALLRGVADIFMVVFETAGDILRVVFDAGVSVFRAAINALKGVWDFAGDTLEAGAGILQDIFESAAIIFEQIWESGKDIFEGIASIFESVFNLFKEIGQTFIDLFTGKIDLFEAATQIFDSVFKAGADILGAVFDTLEDIFGNVAEALSGVFETFKNIGAEVVNLLGDAWDFLVNSFSSIFSALEDVFAVPEKVFGRIIKSLREVFDIFAGVGDSIVSALTDGLDAVGDVFSDFGNMIWEGLKSGLSGIGKLFDDILPSDMFSNIFGNVDFKGQGAVEKTLGIDMPFLNFATGGMVPGSASVSGDSPLNDRIIAMISPGEAVIPRSVAQSPVGGALVQALLSGNLPKFSNGFFSGGASLVSFLMEKVISFVSMLFGSGAFGGPSSGPSPLGPLIDTGTTSVDLSAIDTSSLPFANGGMVPGHGDGDTVRALLTPGEFVMNRDAVRQLGTPFFEGLNSGGSMGQTVNVDQEVNIKIDSRGEKMDEGFVRQRLIPTIKRELKSATLRGELLVSNRGIF